jgi:3-oxoacyl-[acyl-carrier protein] reductase
MGDGAGVGHGAILEGKVALVTGAASGVGRASAIAIARAGAQAIAVIDLDRERSRETVSLVEEAGASAHLIECDVADPNALAAAFAEVERVYGGIDLVHNNAGLVTGTPPWPETGLARSSDVIMVNLGGAVFGTRLGIAALKRRGGGAIVNTASLGALVPHGADAVYNATKAGVVMLTRSCRSLRREGIRINAVCPGAVDTPMLRETGGGDPATWLTLDSIRLLTAEQIAEVVLRVATDHQSAGQVFTIDNPRREPGSEPVVSIHKFSDARPAIMGDNAERRNGTTIAPDASGTPPTASFDEILYTTRAMRRLRTDPVPQELLSQLVEAATMGPSGNFVQNWRFYVVTDRDKIEQLGDLWNRVYGLFRGDASDVPESLSKSCQYMIDHFRDIPAVVFAGATGYPGDDANHLLLTTWYASILPSVQNLMLSARARGLGTTLTTALLAVHDEVCAIVGADHDVTFVACIPVGFPKGRFGRPARNPTDTVAWIDGRPLPPPGVDLR